MNLSFHHIAITANNLKESTSWYQNVFRFEITNEYKKDKMSIVLLQKDDVRVELFGFKDETNKLPDYRKDLMSDLRTVGTKHICLEVDDLEQLIKKLQSRGVETLRESDSTFFGGRNIFIKDPSGNLIELFEK